MGQTWGKRHALHAVPSFGGFRRTGILNWYFLDRTRRREELLWSRKLAQADDA